MNLHLVTIHAMPSPQAVPLAAASLKIYLDSRHKPANPIAVSCSEFYSGTASEKIVSAILSAAPDVVGFPIYVWNRVECCTIVKMLRNATPDIKIMAGGPEATASTESLLLEAPFDFLVTGEGELSVEEAMDNLAAGKNLDGVAGIARLYDGKAAITKRPSITDLSILPSPWLSGLLDANIKSGVVWQLSRGCSFGCDFCFDGMGDRKVRRYPLERLEAELDYFVKSGASQIFVLDSTFNQDVKRAKTLLRLIKEKAPHVHCHFEVRHELLDEEQARLFAELTCSLQIGLQSADPAVAGKVGRKFNRDDFVKKIALLNNNGAIFGFDFIYGLPDDTLERFRDGLEFAFSLYPNHLDIFPLSVLPGTRVSDRSEECGLKHLSGPPYTLLESPSFPLDDMKSARSLGTSSDIFYSRGKAVAWFNGVVSAIKMKPVAFLEEFAGWLFAKHGRNVDESEFNDHQIWQLQRTFLAEIFQRKKMKKLLPLALDFVDYHYHYAASVMAVPPEILTVKDHKLMDSVLVRAESARLAIFHYEILELLESGEPDLPELYKILKASHSFAVIYPRDGEVFTESLAEPFFRLIEDMDGVDTAAKVAIKLTIPSEEASDFIEFAMEEGIITVMEPKPVN